MDRCLLRPGPLVKRRKQSMDLRAAGAIVAKTIAELRAGNPPPTFATAIRPGPRIHHRVGLRNPWGYGGCTYVAGVAALRVPIIQKPNRAYASGRRAYPGRNWSRSRWSAMSSPPRSNAVSDSSTGNLGGPCCGERAG